MNTFNLPDLGEGLPEAEIVAWHVKVGDSVKVDEALVSVETAKAVVEVPSPYSGVIRHLYAQAGDVVETGAPLVDFDDAEAATNPAADEGDAAQNDAGSVVGNVPSGNELVTETAIDGRSRRREKGRVKATPAVRARATRLGIDLALVTPTGKNGQVTADDLDRFGQRKKRAAAPEVAPAPGSPASWQPLRGPRRAMAQSMSQARDQVALCTIFDDADVEEWQNKRDFTARILRAIVAGCAAEPALNGFYDASATSHRVESRVDVAMAVDTADGLIVPVIRNVEQMDLDEIRAAVASVKEATLARSVAPADMLNYTITLSNFGMLAGRYATPVMVPPTVAILGTGKLQYDVVAVMGGMEVHRRIPLSLSFDHRCITGGDACRFLAGVIHDLEQTQ